MVCKDNTKKSLTKRKHPTNFSFPTIFSQNTPKKLPPNSSNSPNSPPSLQFV